MQALLTDLEARAQALRTQPPDVNDAYRRLAESNAKVVEAIRIISVSIANSEPLVQSLASKVQTCETTLQSIGSSMQAVQSKIASLSAQSSGNPSGSRKPASESLRQRTADLECG